MTELKIGDVVRVKTDSLDRLNVIVRDIEHDFASCVSECGSRRVHAWPTELELVNRPDPQADIKQAIREMLLSDEFMTAFAKSWMKTPIPYLHEVSFDNLKTDGAIIGNYTWLACNPSEEINNDPA